jgi:site-specific DNA recombinase
MIAAIYARKSTDQNGVADDQKSIARQVEHATAYAARKGWTVSDEYVFVDDGISGAEFANRPGYLRLLNSLKPRAPFGVLIMSEESRLGRESIEVSYALKQIVTAGVRLFFYLEDRERTLDGPMDKMLLSLTTFADELEREKARQRTYDAMARKARAGHVTGGRVFGYENVEVLGSDGNRSHVRREIVPDEAATIIRIFQLCADGRGTKATAKLLNDEHATSPRAQQGRSQTWSPSSVWEVLHRPLYRGEILWNASRKRDTWGQQHQVRRPAAEHIHVPAEHLRIVPEALWLSAHARLEAARAVYLRGTKGRPFGRPPLGSPSPYLLSGLAVCEMCGGTLKVRTREHGRTRAKFYGCASYHDRGTTVCTNGRDLPMADGDGIVIETLLDDVLSPDILDDAIDGAIELVQGDGADVAGRLERVEQDLEQVERERARLVAAVAAGGELSGLLDALQERERRRTYLQSERESIATQRRAGAVHVSDLRGELTELADSWRHVLATQPDESRPVILRLLDGRVSFGPMGPGRWRMTGRGTLAGLFSRIFPLGVASPARRNHQPRSRTSVRPPIRRPRRETRRFLSIRSRRISRGFPH